MKGLTPTKIEWCRDLDGRKGFTWNIVTGCKNGCSYCYARRLAEGRLKGRGRYVNGFEPTFHKDILNAPFHLKRPSRIFISSMGEIWGPWVISKWQNDILNTVQNAPWHTFLNLTKNPSGLLTWSTFMVGTGAGRPFPPNLWLGVSVTGDGNVDLLNDLAQVDHPNKFVSFEPLIADVTSSGWFTLEGIKWVIIGQMTGPGAKPPKPDWVARIMKAARLDCIPVFIKDNVSIYPFDTRPQQSPEGMP